MRHYLTLFWEHESLNESPSQKEGKLLRDRFPVVGVKIGLNESPSQKEGKYPSQVTCRENSGTPQ